jgi:hypothetical protein
MVKQMKAPTPKREDDLAILVGAGETKVLMLSHGGSGARMASGLAGMIAAERAAGYFFCQAIPANVGELVAVFNKV